MTAVKEKTALITGGSRGIGRAIAVMLAYDSARKIFINYVQNTKEAEKTKAIAEEAGCEIILLKYNLAYPDEIDVMFSEIAEHTDKLDIFVHCAAINSFKPVSKITPKQWDLIMNVNARSFLYLHNLLAILVSPHGIISKKNENIACVTVFSHVKNFFVL